MTWARKAKEYRENLIQPNSCCAWCGSTENLTLEHIIPRSILLKMGYTPMETWELEKNLIVVCRPCNIEKHNTICLKLPETHKALSEIMEKNPPRN